MFIDKIDDNLKIYFDPNKVCSPNSISKRPAGKMF